MTLRTLFAAVLLAAGAAAHAHNYHLGMADIGFNPNTGNTEVVHTYTAHDVEALLANLYQRNFDLGMEEDQAALRRYIEQRFVLQRADGARLPLQWVGVQADAKNIIIYQELEQTALPPGALLRNEVLIDFLPSQVNTVNVGGAGQAQQSLTFTHSRRQQALP